MDWRIAMTAPAMSAPTRSLRPAASRRGGEGEKGDLGAGEGHALLGAAVGGGEEEAEAADKAGEGRVGGQRDGAEVGGGAGLVGLAGQVERAGGADGEEVAAADEGAVGADGEVDLDGVADAVGRALEKKADACGGGAGGGFGDGHGVVDAGGALAVPGEGLLGGALDGEVVDGDCGAAGAARALDDAADQPGLERVAGADEAGEGGLGHDGLADAELAGAEAEAVGAADGFRADHEDGEGVGELDVDGGGAVRAELHPRDVEGDGSEVLADGDVLHAEVAGFVAAGVFVEGDDAEGHAAGVAGGDADGAVDEEGGEGVQGLFLGQRQDGLVDHPDGGFAGEGFARHIGQVDDHVEFLGGAGLGRGVEGDEGAVFDGVDGEEPAAGQGGGLALVEGCAVGGGSGEAAAHEEDVDGEAGDLDLADGDGEAAESVGDVEPLVAEAALGLLDDGQGAGGLEGALDDEGRGLAGVVVGLVGGEGHGLGGGAGPGDGGVAGHEQVHLDDLAAAGLVLGFELHEVDPGVAGFEVEGEWG